MSMSAIKFRGKELWYGDGAIEWWLYALVREIDRSAEVPEVLRKAREIWQREYSIGWGNAPGAHLDDICMSPEVVATVSELVCRVLESLAKERVFRKEELLFAGVGGDILWTEDVPVGEALEVGAGFIELLKARDG